MLAKTLRRMQRNRLILKEDTNINFLFRVIIIGAIAILVISLYFFNNVLAIFGLSTVIALASLFSGGFLGFLFGIPKVLQGSQEGNKATEEKVAGNTNLEQISDWLTKIIVGVSLTQIGTIQKNFSNLAENIAKGFENYMNAAIVSGKAVVSNSGFAYVYSCSLVIFFCICGFILSYIWARIYLLEQLHRLGKLLSNPEITERVLETEREVAKNKEDVEKKLRDIEKIVELKNKLTVAKLHLSEFEKERARIQTIESSDQREEVKQMLAKANPGPVTVLNDGQKGRWGGQSENNDYKLSAEFELVDDSYTRVTVTVESINPETKPLTGNAFFMMHNTFKEPIVVSPVADNKASYIFTSYEAFTVGVVCDGGDTKLELDLNNCENVPDKYKYADVLKTEEQLRREIDEYTNELNKLGQ